MTKAERLIEQFLARPASLRYLHLKKVLECLGFVEISAKGSHRKFKHPVLRNTLVIPVHSNECKSFYKELAAKIVKENNLYLK